MIEKEFGVPFPGQILDPTQWVQTALKKFPEDGFLDFTAIFGRQAPIVIDLGCGNGRFLIQSACSRPEFDHLGIDVLPVVIRYARKRGNQRGLRNLRFAVGGAYELLNRYIEAASVQEIHCYHPQPYYDPKDVSKRLITPQFLTLVVRSLKLGGIFTIQTDHPGYWEYIKNIMPIFFDWKELTGTWPDSPRGRTRREIIARSKKLPIFRGIGTLLSIGNLDEISERASQLKPPLFNADRRLQELDRLA